MKTLIQKLTKLILATFMLLMSFGINNNIVYANDPSVKVLKLGETYLIGDKIEISEDNVWISFIDKDNSNDTAALKGIYTLPEPTFYDFSQDWGFESFIKVHSDFYWGLYFYDGVSAEKKPTGVKCAKGEGTETNPFKFELLYDANPIINAINVTITQPIAGGTVSGDWNTQVPRPEVTIHGSNYYKDESENYWFNEDLTLFEGEFVENEYYYFGVLLRTVDGYEFVGNSSDLTVNITNGEFVKFANYQSTRLAIVGKVKCKAAPQTKELKAEEEYLIGDTIQLSANAYIKTDDEYSLDSPDEIKNGDYTLNKPNFISEIGQYEFVNLFVDPEEANYSLYLGYDTGLTGSEKVKGIKCISGNGTKENPFVFELMFETTNTHKVTFVLNGGEMSPSEVYVEDGEYLKSYEYEPTRLGQYNFEGWYTDSGCQNEFRWWETPIESALTLYAKWSEYYVIKYDFGGGVLWDETGSTFNYPLEWTDHTEQIPLVEDMEDWNYQAPAGTRYAGVNVNGKQYLPGEEVKITGNTTVTLINLPIDKDILTFRLDGGKLGDQEGVAFFPYDNGTKISLPKPAKSGYTFDYWEGSKYYAGDAYTVNGDHTFKAIWKSPSPVKPIVPVIVPVPNTGVK